MNKDDLKELTAYKIGEQTNLEQIKTLQTQIKGLKEAVKHYADKENWTRILGDDQDFDDVYAVSYTNGYEIAQQAIKDLEKLDERKND